MLPSGDALPCPPTLQRRTLSSLQPPLTGERSPPPGSPVPPARGRAVGPVPLPARVATLQEPGLHAHLQRPPRDLVAPEPTAPRLRAPCHLSVCLAGSSRRLAREGGRPLRPSCRWGWGRRQAAVHASRAGPLAPSGA